MLHSGRKFPPLMKRHQRTCRTARLRQHSDFAHLQSVQSERLKPDTHLECALAHNVQSVQCPVERFRLTLPPVAQYCLCCPPHQSRHQRRSVHRGRRCCQMARRSACSCMAAWWHGVRSTESRNAPMLTPCSRISVVVNLQLIDAMKQSAFLSRSGIDAPRHRSARSPFVRHAPSLRQCPVACRSSCRRW
jgi:hypothetical protein